MNWKNRRKLSYLINDFDDVNLPYTVRTYDSDEALIKEIVSFFINGSELIYPAKSYFVALVYAKMLEKYFGVDFYKALEDKELLPDDIFFVTYNNSREIYDSVVKIIGDPLRYEASEKTKQYFYQEFMVNGVNNKNNGQV